MEGCIGAWSPLWWPELQAASPSIGGGLPVLGWRRMQAVLPTPNQPPNNQYSALRQDRLPGGERGSGGGQSMPPHSRGRTNSLTYSRSREMVQGSTTDPATYQREGVQRQGTRNTLGTNSVPRRVEERDRRVRRGGGEDEERRRRGGERRLSAPSSRGITTSESDQFVIDHMVNLELGRGGGAGPNVKATSDSTDLQVSHIRS